MNRFPDEEYREFVADLIDAWHNRSVAAIGATTIHTHDALEENKGVRKTKVSEENKGVRTLFTLVKGS